MVSRHVSRTPISADHLIFHLESHPLIHKEEQQEPRATMSIVVRTALEEDFLAMHKMDFAANATHPFYVIPWKAAGPGASKACMLDRYKHLYYSRNPEFTFLVATAGDEIVGHLLYQKPPGEEEPEEWNLSLPDGTNLRFFEKVFGEIKATQKQYNLKDCWGMYLS
jgi:hypothetical protein